MPEIKKKTNSGWGIIFRYLFEYKKEIVLLSALGVISALANGSIPYIIGKFFDAILTPSRVFLNTQLEIPLWVALLTLWGIAQLIANSVDWISDRKRRKIGSLIHVGYQAQIFSHMLKLPLSFHKDYKAGSITDKISRASWMLATIIENVVISLAPQFLSIVVGLSLAFLIHPLLATVLVTGLALYVGTLLKIVPPIAKLHQKSQEAWSNAYGDAFDALTNVEAVKYSTAEQYEHKKIYHKFIDIVATLWYKVEKIWSGINFYQRIVVVLTQISIFILAVHFIQAGTLTIGELIALNAYAALIFGPFVMVGHNWQIIQNGLVAVEQMEAIINTPQEIYIPRSAVKLKEIKGNVKFQNVSFAYKKGESQVLTDINLKVRAGEVVALVGESGVGKSTVVDLISGYYFPKKGKILIDGHDIKKINLKFLREHIAVVPQEVVLFNDTIKSNIKYGNFKATDEEIKKAAREARADIFIEKFPKKYNQVVGERGIKLSVGQKQRVAIARAILRDPKILILDEPTSALDIETEQYITESLEKLMKGRTTFIIAHRLSTVRRADKIFVFEKGGIVEEGKHKDLIHKKGGLYQRLYNMHIGLQ